MAGGKTRTVYFLEPILLDKQNKLVELKPSFWDDIFVRLEGLATAKRLVTYRGRRYRASARSEKSPAESYIYFGKRRVAADWPDTAVGESDEEPLDLEGDLVEPMYLVPVRGATNFAAFMRTSGGPSFSAFEEWMHHAFDLTKKGFSFSLRPYVRKDDYVRLQRAAGVSKLHMKFGPDALTDTTAEDGRIAAAAKAIQAIGGGGVDVEVSMSFGHATPDGLGSDAFARELEKALKVAGIKKADATLLNQKPDGTFDRDQVEFFRDRVTYSVPVGDSELSRQTPPVVLRAMHEAIVEFRRDLEHNDD